jgi:hypothetical protein
MPVFPAVGRANQRATKRFVLRFLGRTLPSPRSSSIRQRLLNHSTATKTDANLVIWDSSGSFIVFRINS